MVFMEDRAYGGPASPKLFPFMLWLLHSFWQNDTEEASFLNPINLDKDSYITLAKYSVCLHENDSNSMGEKSS